MDNVASMAWNRHAIAQMKIVASMAWGARNFIPHSPRHELDVLRRRRVVDGRADGVGQRPGARSVVSHFFLFRRAAAAGVSVAFYVPPRVGWRLGVVWYRGALLSRPNLGLLGCAWLSVQLIQAVGGPNRARALLPSQ